MQIIKQKQELQPKPLIIEFTVPELWFLVDVMNRVGGHPQNSRRKYADNLRQILTNNGYHSTYDTEGSLTHDHVQRKSDITSMSSILFV